MTISNAQPINAGDYRVVVTDSQGTITSIVATLTVLLSPVILLEPKSLIGPQGSNATLSVQAISGSLPIQYRWRLNGADIPDATNSSLRFLPLMLTKAGGYQVIVSDRSGSITSTVASVTVYNNDVWRFTTVTGNIGISSIFLGTNLIIFMTSAGEAYVDDISLVPLSGPLAGSNVVVNGDFETLPLRDTWFVPVSMTNSDISALFAHSGKYSLHVVSTNPGTAFNNIRQSLPPIDANTLCTLRFWYHTVPGGTNLVVRTFGGSGLMVIVNLQPVDLLPAIALQPGNLSVPASTPASFTVSAFGSEPLSYQWLKDGNSLSDGARIAGATTAVLTLTDVQEADAGNYSVKVSNALGSTNSAQASLALTPALRVTGFAFQNAGVFRIQFSGTMGAGYSVLASSNLVAWQVIGPASETAPGAFEFIDADAPIHETRFYKLTSP